MIKLKECTVFYKNDWTVQSTGIPSREAKQKAVENDWSLTVYGPELHDNLLMDIPEPKGHPICMNYIQRCKFNV